MCDGEATGDNTQLTYILLSYDIKQTQVLADTNFQKLSARCNSSSYSSYTESIAKLNKVGEIAFLLRKEKPQHLTIRLTIKYSFWAFCKQNISLSDGVLTLEPNKRITENFVTILNPL